MKGAATRGVSPQPWAGAPPTSPSTVTIPLQGAPRRPRRVRSRAASYRGGRGTRRARRGHGRREHNASTEHSLPAPERRLVVPYYSAAATAPAHVRRRPECWLGGELTATIG